MDPASAPPRERPASVTIVGGAFLALASFRFVLDCIAWFVWKLGDAERVMRFFLPRPMRTFAPLDWVIRHFATVVFVQAIVALGVALVAYNFLRLRPWARPALETICWIALGGAVALACALGLHAAGLPAGPEARGLSASLAPLFAVAAALGAVIWTVRRPPVLQAFAPRTPQPTKERSLP